MATVTQPRRKQHERIAPVLASTLALFFHLERAHRGGEEVVVLQPNHVLVLGVPRRDFFDVLEQRDHQPLVGFLGLPSLTSTVRRRQSRGGDDAALGVSAGIRL